MKTGRVTEKDAILHRAQNAAADYSLSTGIEARACWLDDAELCICTLCPFNESDVDHEACRSTHIFSALQAERTGEAYFYFCSGSLLFWSSPVFVEGKLYGALIAGPAIMLDKQELLQEWHRNSPDSDLQQLVSVSNKIPRVTPQKAKSLAEMLRISSSWIHTGARHKLNETKDCQDQQSAISAYIHQLKRTGESEADEITSLVHLETDLYDAIKSGNKHQAQKVLNEILGVMFFSTGNSLEIIKTRITELIVILSRAAIAGGADPKKVFSLNQVFLKETGGFRTLDALSYWLSGVLNSYIQQVFFIDNLKHVKRLEKVMHYIQANYAQKISLDELASYAALSPAYFSSVFKEEIGVSVTSFINQIRVGHAKSLLKNTNLKLIDISSMVGFEEQSYFSRVFKQEVGVSPNKYRSTVKVWGTSSQETPLRDFA